MKKLILLFCFLLLAAPLMAGIVYNPLLDEKLDQVRGDVIDGDLVLLDNDQWLQGDKLDGSGYVSMAKVATTDEVDTGAVWNLGPIEMVEDSGVVTVMNMPVSDTPTAGDEMSYTFSIDSNPIATMYAEADGSGGIQNIKITFDGDNDLSFSGGTMYYNGDAVTTS